MPFKSQAQQKWMYANKPAMAKRWQEETPKSAKLPPKVLVGGAPAISPAAAQAQDETASPAKAAA